MKVTFLGTGTSQGIPVITCDCAVCKSLDFRDKRTRTSIHLEVDDQSIIIDTGPDFRQQVLRENIKHLDAVVFTHQHRDHTAGLDEIRSYNFKQKIHMPLYAHLEVMGQLKREFEYIFTKSAYPGVPRVAENIIDDTPFKIGPTKFIPINLLHFKLPVFGFRIGDFAYITDANFIAESEKDKIRGSRVMVINALQIKSHLSHFNLDQALEIIKEIKPEKAYLTHISHYLGLHNDVNKITPENVEVAYDGLKINL